MSLPVGTKLGRYTVESVLGRGGLAEVYGARDDVSGGSVAVKVLHATGPSVVRRLLLEGRAQASLSHANVVGVLDVIDAFGAPALVLERIVGPSLSERLAMGPVSGEEREGIARGLLRGLAAAHSAGLIHRDVKPANLLLHTQDGVLVPKLSDFGLVAVVQPDPQATRLTRTGVGLGTPGYLAPEQLIDAKTVDQRADVFAAAVTLFRLFTGRLPFPGRDPQGFLQAVQGADPDALAKAIPGARGQLLAQCMSPDPARRLEHAGALLRSWHAAVGEGEGAPLAPPAGPARPADSAGVLSGSVDFETALSGLASGRAWMEQRAALSLQLEGEPDRAAVDGAVAGLGGVALHHSGGRLCLMRSEADAVALLDGLVASGHAPRGGLVEGAVQLRQNSAAQVARGARRLEVSGPVVDLAAQLAGRAPHGVVLRQVHDEPPLGWWQIGASPAPIGLGAVAAAGLLATPPEDSEDAWEVARRGALWVPVRPPPHALPAEPEDFFGRERALEALSGLLGEPGVVTLLGVGGIGKTRFALRTAWSQLGRFRGGVWFCDLSEARTLDGVLSVVARALGVPLAQADPLDQLGYALYARGRCLLVLDNLEQITQPAREALTRWRARAPEATFLLTSRVRLELDGERVLPLEPLDTERAGLALFAARYGSANPDFELTARNRSQVVSIVRTLDGLPLALELAAARGLPLEALSSQLSARFGALSGVSGDRESTLVTAIDWSWGLLEGWEQSALAQLSVFVGGFTLEAAEAVLDLDAFEEAPWPEDAVQSLIDKSLLRTWTVTGLADRADIEEPYFGMFVSIHQYAQSKLRTPHTFPGSGPDAERDAWTRHGQHFALLGEPHALDALHGPQGIQLARRNRQELDNLTAATRRAIDRDDPDCAAQAGAAAAWTLRQVGPYDVGVALVRQVRNLTTLSPVERARLLLLEGELQIAFPRLDEAERCFEQAEAVAVEAAAPGLALEAASERIAILARRGQYEETLAEMGAVLEQARAMGHRRAESNALNIIGLTHTLRSEKELSERHLKAGLALEEAHGNAQTTRRFLVNLGFLYVERSRFMDAEPYFLAALESFNQEETFASEAGVHEHMARVRRYQGRMDEAMGHLEAGLTVARRLGARGMEAVILSNLSHLHGDMGDAHAAIQVIDQSLSIHREAGNRRFIALFSGLRGLYLMQLGRMPEAEDCLLKEIEEVHEMGLKHPENESRFYLATIQFSRGDLAEARVALQGCVEAWVTLANPRQRAVVGVTLGRLEARFGDPAAAREASEAALAALEGLGARRFECFAYHCAGEVAHCQGQLEEAEGLLSEALTRASETRSSGLEASIQIGLARLAMDRGRLAEARRLLDDAAGWSRESSNLSTQTSFLAALGRLEAHAGEADVARAHLEAAEASLRSPHTRMELALVLLDRIAAERALGGDPAPALAEARALAEAMAVPEGAWYRRQLVASP